MKLKNLKIIGTILAFLFSFPIHFLYKEFPQFITSIFAPVNESIWEHMKILFTSIILSGIIQKLIIISKKTKLNNVCFSNFIAALSSIPIFLVIFIPIYSIIGENLAMAIIIMLITIIISQIISYIIIVKRDLHLEVITIIFTILIYIAFAVLSYYPIKCGIFMDPKTQEYGIINKK